MTNLAPIEEPALHGRVQRQLVERFAPYCYDCERLVWQFYLATEDEARRMLDAHYILNHARKEPATFK